MPLSPAHREGYEDDLYVFSTFRADTSLLGSSSNSELEPEMHGGGVFYMLSYHRDRMLQAANAFEWEIAAEVICGTSGLRRFVECLLKHFSEKDWNISSLPLPARVRSFLQSPMCPLKQAA